MMKLLRLVTAPAVPSAGASLEEALGLTGWNAGFPPTLPPGQAETDALVAEGPCYLCNADGTGKALPFHSDTGRYRLLVVHTCCGTIGEP
jgi:hypothetical protein